MIYSIISIALIVLSIILVTFNILKEKWHPYLIYFSALFTVYSTTMIGMGVVGSDISRELLMSNLALQNGWDLSLYDPSNTSVLVGWLIPQFSKLTTIDTVWIYKALLPMIFAFTPVILYYIFKKQIGSLKAFYASIFFIIVPVFSLEVATIAKSMVAEPLMAFTIWFILQDISQLKKFFIVLILTLLTLWIHYTVGLILCIYLAAFCGWNLLVFFFGNRESHMQVKLNNVGNGEKFLSYLGILVISVGCFSLYYSNVAHGLVFNSATGIIFKHDYSQSMYVIKDTVAMSTTRTESNVTNKQTITENKTITNYQPVIPKSTRLDSTVQAYSLVLSALGFDIMKLTPSGMAFRIVQMLTQILVFVGFVWMIFKRNKCIRGIRLYRFKSEYLGGCFVAFGLLGACILVPAFASLINATRQYNVSLFFLAPCFVLAFDAIGSLFKNKWANA